MAKANILKRTIIRQDTTQDFTVTSMSDQFIRYGYDVREHSKWTMRPRQTQLKQFCAFYDSIDVSDIRDLSNYLVDEFYVEYSKTHSKNSTNSSRRTLKVFLRWVIGYKEINLRVRPEAIELVRVRDKTPCTIDDELVAEVVRNVRHEQDGLIIAVLREAGLRIGEVPEIRVADVMIDQIHVAGKGEIERNVCVTTSLASKLRQFAAIKGRIGEDLLFQNVVNGYGRKMTVGTIRQRVQKCFRRIAGIHMYPHQLRHSMAIGLLRNGCDLITIQRQLGHADITTTQVYLRVDDLFLREEYAKATPRSIFAY